MYTDCSKRAEFEPISPWTSHVERITCWLFFFYSFVALPSRPWLHFSSFARLQMSRLTSKHRCNDIDSNRGQILAVESGYYISLWYAGLGEGGGRLLKHVVYSQQAWNNYEEVSAIRGLLTRQTFASPFQIRSRWRWPSGRRWNRMLVQSRADVPFQHHLLPFDKLRWLLDMQQQQKSQRKRNLSQFPITWEFTFQPVVVIFLKFLQTTHCVIVSNRDAFGFVIELFFPPLNICICHFEMPT